MIGLFKGKGNRTALAHAKKRRKFRLVLTYENLFENLGFDRFEEFVRWALSLSQGMVLESVHDAGVGRLVTRLGLQGEELVRGGPVPENRRLLHLSIEEILKLRSTSRKWWNCRKGGLKSGERKKFRRLLRLAKIKNVKALGTKYLGQNFEDYLRCVQDWGVSVFNVDVLPRPVWRNELAFLLGWIHFTYEKKNRQATRIDCTGNIDSQYVAAAAYADWLVTHDKMVRQVVEAAIKAGAMLRPYRVMSETDFLKAISPT